MKRYDIINAIIEKCGYGSYLEIGIHNGINMAKINCKEKTGVDPRMPEHTDGFTYHKMPSDDFFLLNDRKFDIVFIDGLHEAEQVMRDYKNSLEALEEGGTIVFHDCNPPDHLSQVVPKQQTVWCGDVWKTWVKINECGFCVDTDFGVGVISFHPMLSVAKKETIEVEDYWDLTSKRKEALRLIPIEKFKRMVND